jgi:hypothetical protein
LQTVQRLINVLTVQHALHRGLKSAVAALDGQAEKSKEGLQKEEPEATPSSQKPVPK